MMKYDEYIYILSGGTTSISTGCVVFFFFFFFHTSCHEEIQSSPPIHQLGRISIKSSLSGPTPTQRIGTCYEDGEREPSIYTN